MDSLITTGMSLLFLMSLAGLIGVAERVLFAFSAYYDARSKMNPDAMMWGFLIGFLGLIPGIIYLCIRNSALGATVCTRCGLPYSASYFACPRCGEQKVSNQQSVNPYLVQQAHRAKILFTVALILIGIGVFMAIMGFTTAAISFVGSPYYN
jgi:hypothetical protein